MIRVKGRKVNLVWGFGSVPQDHVAIYWYCKPLLKVYNPLVGMLERTALQISHLQKCLLTRQNKDRQELLCSWLPATQTMLNLMPSCLACCITRLALSTLKAYCPVTLLYDSTLASAHPPLN